MPRKLPDDAVHRLLVRLEAGEPVPAIAKALHVAKTTVYRIQTNIDIWGKPYPPPTVVMGRPRLLLPIQELVIHDNLVFIKRPHLPLLLRDYSSSLKINQRLISMRCRHFCMTNTML
jgi:hypothetical protein